MRRIDIGIEGHAYSLCVGHGILSELGQYCRSLKLGRQVAVITDQAVAHRCLEPVTASLRQAGYKVLEVAFSGGEEAKNLTGVEAIFGRLIEAGLDRSCWIVALGGGVVGDMAGFVAATYLRGVSCVQVPTTIVAQVDASIGGKTAVNHHLGKNLIGAFHQPRLVWIDTQTLRSLPRRELVAGMAEVVKHAIIRDAELFSFLEENLEAVVALDLEPEQLDWLIARNAEIKARVVEADEKEDGLRAILNYGHTLGHAIEAATNYQKYRHGEAVILGMIAAGEIAVQQGRWPEGERERQDRLLERLGVPGGLQEVPAARIVERSHTDKKRQQGQSRFVLGRRIGQVEIVDGIGEEVVRRAVEYVQEKY